MTLVNYNMVNLHEHGQACLKNILETILAKKNKGISGRYRSLLLLI